MVLYAIAFIILVVWIWGMFFYKGADNYKRR